MEYKTIKELCDLVVDCPHSTPTWTEHGKIVIRNNNIKNGRIDFTSPSFTDDEHFAQRIKRAVPKAGDIVITREAPMGEVGMIPEGIECCLGQRMVLLRANERICDKHYLLYGLQSQFVQHQISWSEGTGTTVSNLRIPHLEQIRVPYVPLDQQKKISSVLYALEDKIENNRKLNDNLLRQAQALYKNRFIDLKPFNGEMPPDWQLGTVSEIIELHDSKRIPLSSRERANLTKIYPYYGATSVMDYVDRYLFDGIYLLLGEDGTVVDDKGFPILQYVEGKFWVNNHAHIITGKNGFTVETLYLLFSLTNVRSIVTGAVQPKISQANLNNVSVVIPSKAELSTFNSIVQPIFSQIRNLRAESDRLTSTRDILLPRLMSGEIDATNIQL